MDVLPNHQKIHEKLDSFHQSNRIPHIIFHGSSGSGKRTIVNDFLLKIYQGDKKKIKTNVMMVNCAHGKGIKFIREELKFFAKTNIQSHNGAIFKTIVLFNAEFLTIDAQSALRRCIELFSYNTRFFIIVENKEKLLNPILSRFCEIYVPDFQMDNQTKNLHQYAMEKKMKIDYSASMQEVNTIMENLCKNESSSLTDNPLKHQEWTRIVTQFYESGIPCMDIMEWVKCTDCFTPDEKSTICMCYDNVKSEFRCEKLLMLYMFDMMFLRNCVKKMTKI
jgi:DNA polymerase III delta prime subunit